MLPAEANTTCHWYCAGNAIFPEMLSAIETAAVSICLETYIYAADPLGERFRDALVGAQRRGVRVKVLVDAVGSIGLPDHFWDSLRSAGGEARYFNPLALKRFWFRDHRKMLLCDGRVAFVGGFNIATKYEGDGVTSGWLDLGLKLGGPLAAKLASSFEEMFARADFRHKLFMRLRRFDAKKAVTLPTEQILLGGPGRGQSPIATALHDDLMSARNVQILMAYFLPTRRLRRDLAQVVQRGGQVQMILAGKTDVLVSQLAAQSLYRRFLHEGVDIFEYQPQVLHSKLIIVDDTVYVGSSNLDQRSLQINYELMLRFQNGRIAGEAREVFAGNLKHSRRVEREAWRASRTIWRRIKQRLAYFILVRMDPYIARWQWRALPD